LLSPARDAVMEQVPVPLDTVIAPEDELTEQAVDPVEL